MKQFDLISDTHIDKWLMYGNTAEENLVLLDEFVDSLLPQEVSNTLVVAGDLGHKNQQNLEFLTSLNRYYNHILLVPGNHDYYLHNSSEKYKYQKSSIHRFREMKALASLIDGIHYLEGTTIKIDDITFGGTGMWYDFSYSTQVLGRSLTNMFDIWHNSMNDEKYIFGPVHSPIDWFWKEKDNLDKIIDKSDVIITHISPDWSRVPEKYAIDPITGCYYFDGREYFNKIEGKIWCFGHTHLHYDYMHHGCWFVNNALGYPKENEIGPSKIVNIPLESQF